MPAEVYFGWAGVRVLSDFGKPEMKWHAEEGDVVLGPCPVHVFLTPEDQGWRAWASAVVAKRDHFNPVFTVGWPLPSRTGYTAPFDVGVGIPEIHYVAAIFPDHKMRPVPAGQAGYG